MFLRQLKVDGDTMGRRVLGLSHKGLSGVEGRSKGMPRFAHKRYCPSPTPGFTAFFAFTHRPSLSCRPTNSSRSSRNRLYSIFSPFAST
eukprot:3863017-Rhodomonas_salina.1